MNFTVSVPVGSTNHGNPNLICTPTQWYDIIVFFFANYVAHAASIILEPGTPLPLSALKICTALLLPASGVVRALSAILRHAVTEVKNPLQRAARAGALCMVIKLPDDGGVLSDIRKIQHQRRSQHSRSNSWRISRQDTESAESMKAASVQNGNSTPKPQTIASNTMSSSQEAHGFQQAKVKNDDQSIATIQQPGTNNRHQDSNTIDQVKEKTDHIDHKENQQVITKIENSSFHQAEQPNREEHSEASDQDLHSKSKGGRQRPEAVNATPSVTPNGYGQTAAADKRPPSGKEIGSGCYWWDGSWIEDIVPWNYNIHGKYWLHEDYCLAFVPPHALLDFPDDFEQQHPLIHAKDSSASFASSYNIIKVLISLAQAIWGIVTLYRSRGDQIQQYGYAAFGLTVAPYVYMSLLNGIANMLTPSYPCMFMIKTPTMEEAEREGKGFFHGAVPVKLIPSNKRPPSELDVQQSLLLRVILNIVLSIVPLVINGGLSHFQNGNSTILQRVFTMYWLANGTFAGYVSASTEIAPRFKASMMGGLLRFRWIPSSIATDSLLILYIIMGSPVAIGGMIVTGQMLLEFGTCILVNS
ncbi:hypothetical protein MMC10_008095 [Thelotrema lepadinum]|nr:hypothetical protein [Thelotrema lepadinum]